MFFRYDDIFPFLHECGKKEAQFCSVDELEQLSAKQTTTPQSTGRKLPQICSEYDNPQDCIGYSVVGDKACKECESKLCT